MKVTLQYMAQLKLATGIPTEEIEQEGPCLVVDLLNAAVDRHPALRPLLLTEEGLPQPALLLFVGDEQLDPTIEQPLQDGCTVTVLSPMAGG